MSRKKNRNGQFPHINKREDTKARYSDKVNSSKSQTNSSKPSVLSKICITSNKYMPIIAFIVFGIVAYIYLAIKNYDYLYACQEHSIWQDTSYFFSENMRRIGGFSEWLGAYFTQYFYYPSLGSIILILMWGIIYFMTLKVFRLSGRWSILALAPCVFLLCSEIELGYWIYYIKMPGYWFTYTIAILIMMLGLFIGRYLRGYFKPAYMLILTLGLYPLIGVWSMLGALILSIQEITGKDKARFVTAGVGLLSSVLSPLIYYNHYSTSRSEDVWTVLFPKFQIDKFTETVLSLPFLGIVIILIFLIFLGRYHSGVNHPDKSQAKRGVKRFIPSVINLCLICLYILSVSLSNVDDANFHSELRMYKSLSECDWDGVLNESTKIQGAHTRQMILCQNVALIHKGGIGDMMFKYDNRTTYPLVSTYSKSKSKLAEDKERLKDEDLAKYNGNIERDSLHINLCNTVGPLIYFMYGKCNFAYRWCIENGVEFTFRVDEYKNMIRCAMMTGEYKLAQKYIDILRNTTFHKEWAEERLAMLHDKTKYTSSEEYKCVSPMYESFKNALDGDQGLVEMYLISYFCHMNSDNKKFQEATLAFSLIQKDISLFWPRFFKYADLHESEPMPIHYQEAAYLFGQLENKVDISKMPFDKDKIINRYSSFKRMTTQLMQMYGGQYVNDEMGLTRKVGEECFAEFGDTYWWFYYFSRNVHTY